MTQPRRRKDDGSLTQVLRYLPLIAVVIAAGVAHVRTEARVESNAQQISRVEKSFGEWLMRVESKLDRAIEREVAR